MKSFTHDEILGNFDLQRKRDLFLSVLIDAAGCSTFLIPGVGEVADAGMAPLLAIAIFYLHRTKMGAGFGFVEEILPFTDIIPTATLLWYKRYKLNSEKTFRLYAGGVQEYDKFKSILEEDNPKKGFFTKKKIG